MPPVWDKMSNWCLVDSGSTWQGVLCVWYESSSYSWNHIFFHIHSFITFKSYILLILVQLAQVAKVLLRVTVTVLLTQYIWGKQDGIQYCKWNAVCQSSGGNVQWAVVYRRRKIQVYDILRPPPAPPTSDSWPRQEGGRPDIKKSISTTGEIHKKSLR